MATNTSAATPGHPPAVPVDADYAEAITKVAPSLLPLFVPIAAFVLLVLPLMYALRRWYATQPAGSRPTLEACVGRPSKQPAEDTPLLVGAAAHPAETAEEEELRPFWIEARDMSVCVVGVLGSHLVYGFYQEGLMTTAWGANEDEGIVENNGKSELL